MFNLTKKLAIKVKGDVVTFNGKIFKSNSIIATAKTLISKETVLINNQTIDIDDLAQSALKNVKIKGKNIVKKIEKYSLYVTGEILIQAGSSTVDDDIIAAAISAAIVACATSMSGSAGTVVADTLTSATVTPIVKNILYKFDTPETELGKKCINKSKSL